MTTMKSQGPGRPKDMEKRAAILHAAKILFAEENFTGTSMDAVAKAAGVSKLTVYSHFHDKDNLFREVLRAWMQEFFPESTYRIAEDSDLRGNLERIAFTHAKRELTADAIGTLRAIISDCCDGSPRYGQMVWQEAIERTNCLLEKLLDYVHAKGWLVIEDTHLAAVHLMVLTKGNLRMRHLLGCKNYDDDTELEGQVKSGVDVFIRAYLPKAFAD